MEHLHLASSFASHHVTLNQVNGSELLLRWFEPKCIVNLPYSNVEFLTYVLPLEWFNNKMYQEQTSSTFLDQI